LYFFFFQAEDGIRDFHVTGVQTCALPIYAISSSYVNVKSLILLYVSQSNDDSVIMKRIAPATMKITPITCAKFIFISFNSRAFSNIMQELVLFCKCSCFINKYEKKHPLMSAVFSYYFSSNFLNDICKQIYTFVNIVNKLFCSSVIPYTQRYNKRSILFLFPFNP